MGCSAGVEICRLWSVDQRVNGVQIISLHCNVNLEVCVAFRVKLLCVAGVKVFHEIGGWMVNGCGGESWQYNF